MKLWLWKNSTPDHPCEFWAFDNPYPVHPNGDPMVFGEPVGYAIFKESEDNSAGRTEEHVLEKISRARRVA
jgi:hypothetical protein